MKKIVFLFVVLLSICFSKDLLQLGAEAYIRGDYKTEPSSLKKLVMAVISIVVVF